MCIFATVLFMGAFLYSIKVTFDKVNEHGIFLWYEYFTEAVDEIGAGNIIFTAVINVTLIVFLCLMNCLSAMA
jgi:F0F1-type ATP synthase membrane subunit a